MAMTSAALPAWRERCLELVMRCWWCGVGDAVLATVGVERCLKLGMRCLEVVSVGARLCMEAWPWGVLMVKQYVWWWARSSGRAQGRGHDATWW